MKIEFSLFIICLFSLITFQVGFGQDTNAPKSLIIQMREGSNIRDLASKARAKNKIASTNALSSRLNIFQVHPYDQIPLSELKQQLERNPAVEFVQYDHPLKDRSVLQPNDPFFSQQWNLNRIGASDIWDKTTGGVTPCGDTIVVAVFDSGLDLAHEDITQNLWFNRSEIPNNSFDDDANGYIDDYYGLNLDTDNDKHSIDIDYHGTSVAGIIGAVGNNGSGISGLNWNVKLLIISSLQKMESQAIKAFDYLIDLREKYNNSNGTEGAYIVAVNNSWGVEGLFEEDFPILCGMFNELGKVGIMGVGATENDQVNTDVFGDIPSDCSSDYLMVVTSTNENDELAVAGWGKENVDLGAPGTNVFSINKEDGYRSYSGGTSYAAPHVSGAIGLLYALPEATFCDEAALSPTDALLRMKRYILDGAKWLPTLNDRTVSGGRLNLTLTLDLITNTPDTDIYPLLVYPNPTRAHLTIQFPETNTSFDRLQIYDFLGKKVLEQSIDIKQQKIFSFSVEHLATGPYLIQLNGGDQLAQKRFIKMD